MRGSVNCLYAPSPTLLTFARVHEWSNGTYSLLEDSTFLLEEDIAELLEDSFFTEDDDDVFIDEEETFKELLLEEEISFLLLEEDCLLLLDSSLLLRTTEEDDTFADEDENGFVTLEEDCFLIDEDEFSFWTLLEDSFSSLLGDVPLSSQAVRKIARIKASKPNFLILYSFFSCMCKFHTQHTSSIYPINIRNLLLSTSRGPEANGLRTRLRCIGYAFFGSLSPISIRPYLAS